MIANEIQIAVQLEHRVRNYRRKTQYEFNWSCDVCGDSARNQRKARFFVGRREGNLVCHCHNCGFSASFSNYLREKHPDLYTHLAQSNILDTAPVTFDYDRIVKRKGVSPDTLARLFYVDKFDDGKMWADHLTDRKIVFGKSALKKMVGIYKEYHDARKT